MKQQENTVESLPNLHNILVLSVGFMLLMAAYLTTAGIEQTVLQSVQVDDPSFTGDGFLSQAIVNGVFSVANFIAPAIVAFAGIRLSLVFGTCLYTVFIVSFLYPNIWFLYMSSACVGIGSAIVWVANGICLTQSSTKETIGKYMGLYWAIMSLGQLSGNVFVYFKFQGMNHIDSDTRILVTTILTVVTVLASVTFKLIKTPNSNENSKTAKQVEAQPTSICKRINSLVLEPFRLLKNKHMLLLIPTSMFNGMEVAFFTAIYPTAVGFTEAFGGDTRKLVGLAGILIGLGSMMGGFVLGFLVDRCTLVKSKRSFIVTLCCLGYCFACVLMFLNHPDAASQFPTLETSFFGPPCIYMAMLCAFLLGVGDGCISPQMCAAIGVIWPEDPSAPLALYLFFKAATCSLGMFIGTLTGLYNQVLIFLALTIIGTLTFRINEDLIDKGYKSKKVLVASVDTISAKVEKTFPEEVKLEILEPRMKF